MQTDDVSKVQDNGILRARYRNSFMESELITPEHIYRFDIELSATAQVFQAGHQLRIEVTSSDFPRYDRNLNTGEPFGSGVQGQIAQNTVFHNQVHSSHVLLPIYLE